VTVWRDSEAHIPKHLSKEQDVPMRAGDRVSVETPGGGGYGDPFQRWPELVLEDVRLGFYTTKEAAEMFGVAVADGKMDEAATTRLRGN
jgi:N-methylhydantoinase B